MKLVRYQNYLDKSIFQYSFFADKPYYLENFTHILTAVGPNSDDDLYTYANTADGYEYSFIKGTANVVNAGTTYYSFPLNNATGYEWVWFGNSTTEKAEGVGIGILGAYYSKDLPLKDTGRVATNIGT